MIVSADVVLAGRSFEVMSPGCVRVENGRVAAMGDVSRVGETVIDVRRASAKTVLLAGYVDAHCHLELSNLRGRIRWKGSLVRWLGELVIKRAKRWRTQASAVRAGVSELLAGGTTTVCDISANSRSIEALADTAIRAACCAEIVGIGRKRHVSREMIEAKLQPIDTRVCDRLAWALSPHAPYSTDAEVYRLSLALAEERRCVLATHLAEDRAEAAFVADASGAWRTVLKTFGVWDASIVGHGCSPVAYAKSLGVLSASVPVVLAHVNYVDDDDIAMLADSAASVAYCPLAHAYFCHEPHRYREMLAAGVNVALGNDSLACSPVLSIAQQMRRVWMQGGVSARQALAMATTHGAKALGQCGVIGEVSVGARADLVAVALTEEAGVSDEAIVEAIVAGRANVVGVWVAGQRVDLLQVR